MDNKLYLCHNKNYILWTRILCVCSVSLIIGFVRMTTMKIEDWISFIFMVVIIATIWIYHEIEYHFHELKIKDGECK